MHACEHGFGVFGIYNSENLFATFGKTFPRFWGKTGEKPPGDMWAGFPPSPAPPFPESF